MKTITKYVHAIVNIVLFYALVISVILLVLSANTPLKKITIYNVVSGSMEPVISTGSIVITQNINPEDIEVNDVISYTSENSASTIITHRVVKILTENSSRRFITKGDANSTPDPDEIEPFRIQGKAITSIPKLGYVLGWLKSPRGFLLAIILPAVFIILNEIKIAKKAIEQAAIEKYRKNSSLTAFVFILMLASLSIGFFQIQQTSSYFSSGMALTSNVFSIGHTDPGDDEHNPKILFNITEGKHFANFRVVHVSRYTVLTYFLSYESDNIPQGVMGTIQLNGEDEIIREKIDLGSCSSGKICKYGKYVEKIVLNIDLMDSSNTTIHLTAMPQNIK